MPCVESVCAATACPSICTIQSVVLPLATADVCDKLDKGLIDFGIPVEPADLNKYDYLRLPEKDTWGVLMPRDCPLSERESVTPEDLYDLPLLLSKHTMTNRGVSGWFKRSVRELNVATSYNLIYNASLLVKEGVGYAVCLDKLINTSGGSDLTFRPLEPRLTTALAFAWKRRQVFSEAAELYLEIIKELSGGGNQAR